MLPTLREPNDPSRYPKALSEWLQLDYFRRPRRLRGSRWTVAWGVFLGCIALVGVTTFVRGDRRIYQAGPVSQAHALFNDDCAACHYEQFPTGLRLISGDASIRAASDAACLSCHDGAVHNVREAEHRACASCHREHRGRAQLARVADSHCTSCHSDLERHTNTSIPAPDGRTYRDVSAFEPGGHPEFALWDDPRDPGTLRFNHARHLDPAGVLEPGSRRPVILRCADCHVPDADRRYMQPIAYEQHCARCHALTAGVDVGPGDERAHAAAATFLATPARHPGPGESASNVRAELRERLIRFARENPSVLAAPGANDQPPARPQAPPLPGRRTVPPVSEAEWGWVNGRLAAAERVLYDGAGGCKYCHGEATTPAERPEGLPAYEPPRITARWLAHGGFSHDSHRAVDCQGCHAGTSTSKLTSDVLMPRVESCQSCHAPRAAGSAGSDCITCHSYHDRSKDRPVAPSPILTRFLDHLASGPAGKIGEPREHPADPVRPTGVTTNEGTR